MGVSETVYHRIDILGDLSSEHLKVLLTGHKSVSLRAGQLLFSQGEIATQFAVITSGLLKIVARQKGRPTLLSIIPSGEVAGALLMAREGGRYPGDVSALTYGSVILIPQETYQKHWMSDKVIMTRVMMSVQNRCFGFQSDRALGAFKLDQRLAGFIFRYWQTSPFRDEQYLTFKITRQELGSAVGANTESVIRAMRKLEKMGLVETSKGLLRVIDPIRLEEFLKE